METVGDESVLAEFTMYFLCPGKEVEGDEKGIVGLVSQFDTAQKSMVEDFLRSIVETEALKHWHPYAEYGIKWWSASEA